MAAASDAEDAKDEEGTNYERSFIMGNNKMCRQAENIDGKWKGIL